MSVSCYQMCLLLFSEIVLWIPTENSFSESVLIGVSRHLMRAGYAIHTKSNNV